MDLLNYTIIFKLNLLFYGRILELYEVFEEYLHKARCLPISGIRLIHSFVKLSYKIREILS